MSNLLTELSIENYEQELERKSKLENKALAYLSFVSIILATISALYLYFLSSKYNQPTPGNAIFIWLFHSIVIYILLLCFTTTLVLYLSLNIKKMSKFMYTDSVYRNLKLKESDVLNEIVTRKLIKFTNKNIQINNKIEDRIRFAYFGIGLILLCIGLLALLITIYAI